MLTEKAAQVFLGSGNLLQLSSTELVKCDGVVVGYLQRGKQSGYSLVCRIGHHDQPLIIPVVLEQLEPFTDKREDIKKNYTCSSDFMTGLCHACLKNGSSVKGSPYNRLVVAGIRRI
jgi:hypothetical protein